MITGQIQVVVVVVVVIAHTSKKEKRHSFFFLGKSLQIPTILAPWRALMLVMRGLGDRALTR